MAISPRFWSMQGISVELPSEDKFYVGFIKLKMKAPNDRGLISQEEETQLSFIEDKIEMESLRYRVGNYVGKIVSNNEITFIYYLKYDFEWPNAVQSAMNTFPIMSIHSVRKWTASGRSIINSCSRPRLSGKIIQTTKYVII